VSRRLAELDERLQRADEERLRLRSTIVDKDMEIDALHQALEELRQARDELLAEAEAEALERVVVDLRFSGHEHFEGEEAVEIEAIKLDGETYQDMALVEGGWSGESSRGAESDREPPPSREDVGSMYGSQASRGVAELDERLQEAEQERAELRSAVLDKNGEIDSLEQAVEDLRLNDDVSIRLAALDERVRTADEDRARLSSTVVDREAEIDDLKRMLADIQLNSFGNDTVMRADLVRSSSSRSEDWTRGGDGGLPRGFQDSYARAVRDEQERAVDRARRTSREQASLRRSAAAVQRGAAAYGDDAGSLDIDSVISGKPSARSPRTARALSPERRAVLRDQERAIELAMASSSRRLSGRSLDETRPVFRDKHVEDEDRSGAGTDSSRRRNDRSMSPSRQRVLEEQKLAIERARSSSSVRTGRPPLTVTSPALEEPSLDGEAKLDRSGPSSSPSRPSKRPSRRAASRRRPERQQERSIQRKKRRFFNRLTWFGRSQLSDV
jgi:hypothetical protein